MPLEEIMLAAAADAIFGYAVDKLGNVLDGWKSERETKNTLKEVLRASYDEFSREEPQWVGNHFDLSFFEREGKTVLAQFLVRDGRPEPGELAERWADSLNIQHPERRMLYVREVEPVAATFLDLFAHQLKAKASLREINDSRVWEQLGEDIRAMRKLLGAEKATRGTRRDYLLWLMERNLYVDARGTFQTQRQVQLRLDEIYISLRAQRDDTPSTVDRRQLQELEGKLGARTKIKGKGKSTAVSVDDDDLSAEELEDRLEHLHLRATKMELAPEILELAAAVSKHDRLVILGDPGSGKTTLLRYLALKHTQALLTRRNEVSTELGMARFPIYIRISEYAQEGNWKRKSLSEFLSDAYKLQECPSSGLADLLQSELDKGECLVLLDGLDEIVGADERRGVVSRIEDFVRHHVAKKNRFLVTSRIAGYRVAPLEAPFTHYTVRDMDEAQMQHFLARWCQAVEDAQTPELSLQARQRVAQDEVNNIMKAIRTSSGVRRLATNPLLLRTLALIHKTGSRLPNKRIKLYQLAADTLAHDWRVAQGVSAKAMEQESELVKEEYLTPLLSSLAYWMHQHKSTGIATEKEVFEVLGEKWADLNDLPWNPDRPNAKMKDEITKFLRVVREHTGLFVERAPKRYGFMHLTFEEYYAARYLVERSRTRAQFIRQHLHEARWQEPILLALGFVGLDYPKEASELVETAILAQGKEAPKLGFTASKHEALLGRDFLFALRCLGDDIPVRRSILEQLTKRLADELLYNAGLMKYERYEQALRERAEYLAGSTAGSILASLLLVALHDAEETVRSQAARSLGEAGQGSAEVVQGLLVALHDAEETVRSQAARSLGEAGQGSAEVVQGLLVALHDAEETVRWQAAQSLGQVGQGNAEVVEGLLMALHDADGIVRSQAARSLVKVGQGSAEVVQGLLVALHDTNGNVRSQAAQSLGQVGQGSAEVVQGLLMALHDTDGTVRFQAAGSLVKVGQGNAEVVQGLLMALHSTDETVRSQAARSLGQVGQGNAEVVQGLLAAMHDADKTVRWQAAESLGEVGQGSAEVVEGLLMALHDADGIVRSQAAGSLGEVGQGNAEVVEGLLMALHDADGIVRSQAAKSLGQVGQGNAEVVQGLLVALHDADKTVRSQAARSLVKVGQGSAEVVQGLLAALQDVDADKEVSYQIAISIGKLAQTTPEIVALLVNAVHDSNKWEVRRDSINLLSELEQYDKRIIDTFWSSLLDEDNDVRDASVQALVQVGRELQGVQKQQFEARLVRAIPAKKYEKTDIYIRKPASSYIYDVLWQLVVEDEQE